MVMARNSTATMVRPTAIVLDAVMKAPVRDANDLGVREMGLVPKAMAPARAVMVKAAASAVPMAPLGRRAMAKALVGSSVVVRVVRHRAMAPAQVTGVNAVALNVPMDHRRAMAPVREAKVREANPASIAMAAVVRRRATATTAIAVHPDMIETTTKVIKTRPNRPFDLSR
jgi:hypothetical protein